MEIIYSHEYDAGWRLQGQTPIAPLPTLVFYEKYSKTGSHQQHTQYPSGASGWKPRPAPSHWTHHCRRSHKYFELHLKIFNI